jgi:hypothetical protein
MKSDLVTQQYLPNIKRLKNLFSDERASKESSPTILP